MCDYYYYFFKAGDSKDIKMLQKIYISNKFSLELSIYQKIKKIKILKKVSFRKYSESIFFYIGIQKHISLFQNQHIRMICEGSCDTEDWSNDAENTALQSEKYIYIFLNINIESSYFALW